MTEPTIEAGTKSKTRAMQLGSVEVTFNTIPEHVLVAIYLRLRRIERSGEDSNATDVIDIISSAMMASCSTEDQARLLGELEAGRVGVQELLEALIPAGNNRAERRAVEASRSHAPAAQPAGNQRRRGRRR